MMHSISFKLRNLRFSVNVPSNFYATNESMLMEIGHARRDMSLRQRAAKQKLMFIGHVMRANGIEKNMMLAYREGRRKRSRLMKRWMEEILTMSGMNLTELRNAAEDRDFWRKLTLVIARALRVDSTR